MKVGFSVTILIAIATLLLYIPNQPPDQTTANKQGTVAQKEQCCKANPGLTVNSNSKQPNTANRANDSDAERERLLNTLYLVSAPFVVLIGVATGVLVWRQIVTLKNIERAWIDVSIEYSPGMKGRFLGTSKVRDEPETHHTDFIFRFACANHGRTPALITEKRANLIIVPKNTLPKYPDLGATRVFDDRAEPLAVGKESLKKRDEHFSAPGYQSLDDLVVLYGVVKYRDVFRRTRQTTFGYEVTIGEKIERLSSRYRKYNENT